MASFQNLVTICILVAGLTVGLNVDGRGDPEVLYWIDIVCLAVFTVECAIKILACGRRPQKYFKDKWNQFDFIIVLNGLVELVGLFALNFLVVFRLLRLLRVFRLARAFPRLRSIVSSLLEAIKSVGWMVLLFMIFNYIMTCCGMILFQKHDPFYFGELLAASFTIYQMSTLDIWDVVMRINMYGCESFPRQLGYPVSNDPDHQCENPRAFGYIATLFVGLVVVFGALILPTMLIGVVSIKFEQSTHQFETEIKDLKNIDAHLALLREDEEVKDFFDDERVEYFKGKEAIPTALKYSF